MTVITRMNATGRHRCVCGSRAVIADSRFHPIHVIYLCLHCAEEFFATIRDNIATLKQEGPDDACAP